MPEYRKSNALRGGVAIEDDRWQIELYAHPDRGGLVLEIRMASTGVVTGIADVRKDGAAVSVSPFELGELSRLPPRLVLEKARRWAEETVV